MSSNKKVAFAEKQPIPEEEEDDELSGEEEEEDEDEEMDLNFDELEAMDETLASYLTTEDGDNVATALMSVSDNMATINSTLELQNKILIKILSHLGGTTSKKTNDNQTILIINIQLQLILLKIIQIK